jgi:predicted type IV restriction endonuclease
MDLIDNLRQLATRIAAVKDTIQTEEATKNAMVMPLIQMLGYNVFDPFEVTPELIADHGTKKGEKVDYAILKEGKPIILFECKKVGSVLDFNHAGQLSRYFHTTAARFGVLCNGISYWFFTDLDEPNKMDSKPFFEFNLLEFRERDVEELKKFTKSAFDIDAVLTTANELKYTRSIQQKIAQIVAAPPEDFVRSVAQELIGSKRFTQTLKDQFTIITKRAFEQLISERINERLKGAMSTEALTVLEQLPQSMAKPENPEAVDETTVVTTPEELEGFHIVKSILRKSGLSKRLGMRDAQSYCVILLDDSNRKTVCRLRFNNVSKLRLGLVDGEKEETIDLASVDDLHDHAERIEKRALSLVQQPKDQPA